MKKRNLKPKKAVKMGAKPKKLSSFNPSFAKIKRAVSTVSSKVIGMAPKAAKKAPAPATKNKKAAPPKGTAKVTKVAKTAAKVDPKSLKKAPPAKAGKPQVVAAVMKTPTAKAAKGAADFEKLCRENGCENVATTKGYCRLDYIKNWKKIKRKEMILKEGKLNQYIEELVSKYPDKYIDVIRQDLSSEVNFNKVIHDLELDESIDDLDYDGDSIDSLIGSIRKEEGGFDDEEF